MKALSSSHGGSRLVCQVHGGARYGDLVESFRATVLGVLGNAPDVIEPGRMYRFGTNGRGGDSAGWCKLFDDLRGGVFGCYRQGISKTWSASCLAPLSHQQHIEFARQALAAAADRQGRQQRKWSENALRISQLWTQCVPLATGCPGTLYLKQRGIDSASPLPGLLRVHRALPYWNGSQSLGMFPAMVAPIVAPNGRIVALHQTYLTADGHKADVPTVKKLTGAAGPLAGACIPLFAPANGCIGISEGIETALAATCASGVPAVAAYCAENLAAWQWPPGVRTLVIFADADLAGRHAAHRLKARGVGAGLHVHLMTPTDEGADWCDVWAQRDALLIKPEGAR
jgi:putative DNA primase/helicase